MSTRQQIIANALRQRFDEVCSAASQPAPNVSGEMTDFVSHLRQQLVTARSGHQLATWTAPEKWFESRSDPLKTFRELAANEQVECIETAPPKQLYFFDDVQVANRQPQRRFMLLAARYLHPLNIAAASEQRVREHLLERLMVADRSRIEQHSLDQLDADDLLLRLNLIAIFASLTTDLRYLDALNYYYELLPPDWWPESPQNWLRQSFLNFYARALAVHSAHVN